jgi:hypothetical protein
MLLMKFTITRMSVLAYAGVCLGQNGPAAIATNGDVSYCFARVQGLDPGRQPSSYVDLQVRVKVSYHNAGTRPLILPLERVRTTYYGFEPGEMRAFRENVSLLETTAKPMKNLPDGVSLDSPVDPSNDFFTLIPAGGEMTPPLWEYVTLPVNRIGLFRKYPDLRGHRVYVKLQFAHRELSPTLKADLSDWWSRVGVPWTGTLTTNTFVIDVPAAPPAVAACVDPQPAHPESSRDNPTQSGK